MALASLLSGLGGDWVAAIALRGPRAHVIEREAIHAGRGLLAALFWTNPFTKGAVNAVHALIAGCIAGLGRGLPIAEIGQSFAWPFLLHWPGAILPGTEPALRTACLLGASLGLAALLRIEWAAAWASARADTARDAPPAAAVPAPEMGSLLLAGVPAFLLCWLLRHLTTQLLAAATVGVFLLVTAQLLALVSRWADTETAAATAVPPWLAAGAGVGFGLAALPGISGLVVLMAILLYGRIAPEVAGTFALMAATIVAALLGLFSLPAAATAWSAAVFPALLGAAVGAYVGGWLLRRWLGPDRARALPILASYCAAMGGLMLLFGVFTV